MSVGKARKWVCGTVLFAAMTAVSAGDASAGALFSDDFEAPNLLTTDSPPGAWASVNEAHGTVSIATSPKPVLDGNNSCELYWSSGGSLSIQSPDWSPVNEWYAKLYVLIHDYTTAGDQILCRFFSGSGGTVFNIFFMNVNTRMIAGAGPAGNPGGGWVSLATGTTTLEEDRWYCIQLHYQHCSAPGTNDGRVTVWLDGNLEIDALGLDTSDGTQVNPVVNWVLGQSGTLDAFVYYDNVSVADEQVTTLEIFSPLQGDAWADGSTHEIRWLAGDTGAVPNVHIELSRDNGTSWEDIIASVANTGSYSWTVTDGMLTLPQHQCIIRISDVVDGIPQDRSGVFSITAPALSVTNPAGGEEWGTGGSRTITWTTEGSVVLVDVQISRDGGTTWEDIATGVANSGSYVWSVDDGGQAVPQNNCIIRVRDSGAPGTYDDSEPFTIAAGQIVVTLPTAAESWEGGSAQEIHWTSNIDPVQTVSIAISYDGGVNYQTLTATTANDGISFFGVPDHPTTQARIGLSSGVVTGESGNFTITPQSYTWLFQDGFESGTLLTTDTPPGAWDDTRLRDNSSLTVVTAPPPHAGTYCLEMHLDNATGGDGDGSTYARVRRMVNSSGMASGYCRAYIMQEVRPTENFLFNLMGFEGDGTLLGLYMPADTGELYTGRASASSPIGGTPVDISAGDAGALDDDGAWHQLDLYYKPSTVDSAGDGMISLYYDGAFAASATGIDTTSSLGIVHGVKMVVLNGWNGDNNNMDGTVYWDDVSVGCSHPGGPFPVVVEPSGSEEWVVGQPADITWHVTDKLLQDITHVDIEISRDNGTTWDSPPIATNVDVSTLAYDAVMDCYTYAWTVTDGGLPTDPPQDLCLIRITDVTPGNPGNSDDCDFSFSIGQASITVLTPNGGEVWGIGTNRDITWDYFGVDTVTIRVSYNNGGSWTGLITTLASDRSYTWTVTAALPSVVCLVQIEDTAPSGAIDESDAVFSIVNPTLQVTAPNGGEAFDVGEATNITWNSTGLLNVEIELSRDGNWTNGDGSDVEVLVASIDASLGTYAWTVTGPLSVQCLIRISDDLDGDPFDESGAVFTIQGLDLTVPSGGETCDAGTTQTITWDAQGVAQLDIELSRDGGGSWEVIQASVDATTGTYDWDVTGPGSAQCIIRISDSGVGTASDQSDNVFIIAGVEVTVPNGAEFWSLGENVNITWNSAGFANAMIELSRDGNWVDGDGSDVEILAASADATVGSVAWIVTGPSSTTCLVRISDTDGSPSDESDAVFEILAPAITVTSPAPGDVWPVGSSQDITWSCTGITNVKIDVSRDGEITWEEIVATTGAAVGSYAWGSVTGPGSTNCMIRVRDTANPWTIYGDSAGFTISEIAVVTPAAGDTWCWDGDDQDITWTSAGITGNVDIAYSTDGGTNWTDIATNETDDGSYTWTIPNEDSTNCVVRVEETGGGGAIGLSEVFTLTPATITVTLPVVGSSWGLGTAQTITWNSAGLANVMIELSRDGNWVNGDGSDVETIVASTDATTGNYTWDPVTGPESTNCLVRVSDANDGVPSNVSGTFTIATSSLALASPDGGEVWSIGKTVAVTWDQVGVAALQIELSTDGGTTWTEIAAAADGQVGSYAWTLNAAASGNCTVRITAGGALTDSSAGTFWIIRPNGDTDGDGFTDQEEVDGGTNPFDKDDKPPVMFHGKTGCGAASVPGGLLPALLAALAGMCVLKRRK